MRRAEGAARAPAGDRPDRRVRHVEVVQRGTVPHREVVEAVTATGAELHKHYRPGVWLPHCSLAPRATLAQLPDVAAAVFDVLPLVATADRAALNACLEVLQRGEPLVLFPEGTRVREEGLGTPKRGAARLAIEAGEMVLVSGRSGSGKSTLLRAASGLVPHFHGGDAGGAAWICGMDLAQSGPAELGRVVGMVAQEPETQVVSATVRAEIELPLEIRGEATAARARAVEEVAQLEDQLVGPGGEAGNRLTQTGAVVERA